LISEQSKKEEIFAVTEEQPDKECENAAGKY
jgi:hypothetical protein